MVSGCVCANKMFSFVLLLQFTVLFNKISRLSIIYVFVPGFIIYLNESRRKTVHARIRVFAHWLNEFQELLTLEPKSEGETGICLEIFSDQRNTLRTAFSNIVAEQTSSSKEKTVSQVHEHLGVSTRGIIEEVSRKSIYFFLMSKILYIHTSRALPYFMYKDLLNLE